MIDDYDDRIYWETISMLLSWRNNVMGKSSLLLYSLDES